MPSTVDERIVEMQFNNSQFEKNAGTTINTLGALKTALNFGGVTNQFETLQYAASSFDSEPMVEGVSRISDHFSALGIIADQVLRRIGDMVFDVGNKTISMAKSLSIDQISAGWDKYAEKTSAVQTIMSATAKQFTDTNVQMASVEEQLDRLNWFTDETSYSFLDMVNNIGKFTSNNVALDESVNAMMGISTWAALSGANVNEAGRAMYNLSQSLAIGAVKLQDWKSIENANMSTVEFKETVMQTAVETGQLKKVNDKYYTSLKNTEVTVSNFNQTLSEGWFNSETLLKSLGKYGNASQVVNEVANATGDLTGRILKSVQAYKNGELTIEEYKESLGETTATTEELTKWFDTLASDEYDLGVRALRAAQETKTFGEVISATKDAVSSGWMETFEIIFGNYNEAKALWSEVAEVFYDIFAGSKTERNNMLRAWKELGGRDSLIQSVVNIYEAFGSVIDTVREKFREIFPRTTSDQLFALTKGFEAFTESLAPSEEVLEKVGNVAKALFQTLDFGWTIIKEIATAAWNLVSPLITRIGGGVLTLASNIGSGMSEIFDTLKQYRTVYYAVKKISDFLHDTFGPVIDYILDKLEKFLGADSKVGQILNGIKEHIVDFIPKLTVWLRSGENIFDEDSIFGGFLGTLKKASTNIRDYFKNIIDAIKGSSLSEHVHDMFESIKEAFRGFKETLKSMNVFGFLIDLFKTLGTALTNIIGAIFEGLKKFDLTSLLNGTLFAGLLGSLGGASTGLGQIIDRIKGLMDDMKSGEGIFGFFSQMKDAMTDWQNNIKADTLMKIAGAIAILAVSMALMSGLDMGGIVKGLGAISILFQELMMSMAAFSKIAGDADGKKLSKATTSLVALSASILILSSAVKKLGKLNVAELAKGLGGVAILLTELALFTKFADASKIKMSNGAAIMLLASGIGILSLAVKAMGKMDANQLIKGLGGIGVLLLEIGAFSAIISKTSGFKMMEAAIAIDAMSVGLLAMTGIVALFGMMSLQQLGQGLAGVGASLAILAVGMHAMNGTLAGSAAMLVMAGALALFTPQLVILGLIPAANLAKGLLALAASFTIIGIAGYALAGAVPAILALSGALALAGVGIVAIGAGFTAIAVGLTAIATAVTGSIGIIVDGLALILATFINFIPQVVLALGKGLVQFIELIGNAAEQIGIAFLKVLKAIVNAIVEGIPMIMDGAGKLILALLQVIQKYGPDIIRTAIQIVIDLMEALVEKIPELVETGVRMVVEFIDGLANAIREHTKDIMLAVKHLMAAIINFILTALQEMVKGIPIIGEDLSNAIEDLKSGVDDMLDVDEAIEMGQGYAKGIGDGARSQKKELNKVGKDLGKEMNSGYENATKDADKLGKGTSDKLNQGLRSGRTDIYDAGKFLGLNATDGMDHTSGSFDQVGRTLSKTGADGLLSNQSMYSSAGQHLSGTFSNSIGNSQSLNRVNAASNTIGLQAVNTLSGFGSAMTQTGSGLGSNYASGISSRSKDAGNAASGLGTNAVNNSNRYWGMYEQGGNTAAGYAKGIADKVTAVIKAAKSMASNAISSVAKTIRSNSPAKAFIDLGEYSGEGYAIGIDNEVDNVEKSAEGMATASIKSVGDAISKIRDALDEDMDQNPTITPVLDLSNIWNGASEINDILGTDRAMRLTANNDSINPYAKYSAIASSIGGTISGGNSFATTINIYQQPGQSNKELADLIEERIVNNIQRRGVFV